MLGVVPLMSSILMDTVEESPQLTSPITKHNQRHSQRLNVHGQYLKERRMNGRIEKLTSEYTSVYEQIILVQSLHTASQIKLF